MDSVQFKCLRFTYTCWNENNSKIYSEMRCPSHGKLWTGGSKRLSFNVDQFVKCITDVILLVLHLPVNTLRPLLTLITLSMLCSLCCPVCCTLFAVPCILYSLWYTLYVLSMLYCVVLDSVFCMLYSLCCTLNSVLYALYSLLCNLWCTLYAALCMHATLSTLYSLCYIQYAESGI